MRRYDAKNIKLSKKTSYPRNLPRNAYRETWIQGFPNISLSVNPGAAYDLTHHPEAFRLVAFVPGLVLIQESHRYLGISMPDFLPVDPRAPIDGAIDGRSGL